MAATLRAPAPREDEEEPDGDLPALQEAWRWYNRSLRAKPLATKAVTSGIIAAVGQILASALRGPPPAGTGPSRMRSVSAFFVFGLVINGPFFHWWYGALERICDGVPSTTSAGVLYRLALDRLLTTPPFLAVTLAGLHWLQHLSPSKATAVVKQLFWGALFMNWKVWSVAQVINFKFVPIHLRVVFGNLVALWWNIYLAVIQRPPPVPNAKAS